MITAFANTPSPSTHNRPVRICPLSTHDTGSGRDAYRYGQHTEHTHTHTYRQNTHRYTQNTHRQTTHQDTETGTHRGGFVGWVGRTTRDKRFKQVTPPVSTWRGGGRVTGKEGDEFKPLNLHPLPGGRGSDDKRGEGNNLLQLCKTLNLHGLSVRRCMQGNEACTGQRPSPANKRCTDDKCHPFATAALCYSLQDSGVSGGIVNLFVCLFVCWRYLPQGNRYGRTMHQSPSLRVQWQLGNIMPWDRDGCKFSTFTIFTEPLHPPRTGQFSSKPSGFNINTHSSLRLPYFCKTTQSSNTYENNTTNMKNGGN